MSKPSSTRLTVTGLTWPLRLYRLGTRAVAPLAGGLFALRKRNGKEDRTRLGERRGFAGRKRPPGPLAWMHGASVGETTSMLPIIEHLARQGFTVLVTSGTVTSAKLLAARLPARTLHQYVPLDVPRYMNRFLDYWRPDLVLVAESEIWPNTIIEIKRRSIPLLLLNARMSERSFRRWRKVAGTASAILQRFDLCLAQTPADASRLERLGAPRVIVAGNIKYDVPPPPANPATVAMLEAIIGERPVWVAASTHPGEDEMVIAAHKALADIWPGLLTIIAPRHPDRGEGIADLAMESGLRATRRAQQTLPENGVDIYIADTIGELGLFYRIAPITFIGGSLVAHGGQNPIEPAKLGCAILHGPHVRNFADVYASLDSGHGAVPITDADELAITVHALLEQPVQARAMARNAANTVASLGGAVAKSIRSIEPYILYMHLQSR